MTKQRYIVEIEMPDGDFISAGRLKDLIQTDCDLEDEGRKKVTVQETSLPSNLDEAARRYAIPSYMKDVDENYLNEYPYNPISESAFKAGAEWMAGQFQKIEGELVDWYSTNDGKDYCCGIKSQDAFEVPEGFYIRKK